MLTWLKQSKEVRIALAVCAGLLGYRLVVAALSVVSGWLRSSSSSLETLTILGFCLLVGGVPMLVLWRFFRRKTATS